MGRWDDKRSDTILSIPKRQFYEFLGFAAIIGIGIGYVASWGVSIAQGCG